MPNLAIAKLEALLDERHMTAADLARVLGVDRAAITHWRHGSMPRQDKRDRITEWSDGTIRPADWLTPGPPTVFIDENLIRSLAAE